MRNSIFLRIICGLAAVALIMWGYWWLAWIFFIVLLFIFPVYFEILIWGVVYDSLYGAALPELYHIRLMFTVLSFVLFFFSLFLKKRLIAYDSKN